MIYSAFQEGNIPPVSGTQNFQVILLRTFGRDPTKPDSLVTLESAFVVAARSRLAGQWQRQKCTVRRDAKVQSKVEPLCGWSPSLRCLCHSWTVLSFGFRTAGVYTCGTPRQAWFMLVSCTCISVACHVLYKPLLEKCEMIVVIYIGTISIQYLISLRQQATPTSLQVLYEANIYFCFVQTPLYEVLKIIKCSEIICDAKMTVRGTMLFSALDITQSYRPEIVP